MPVHADDQSLLGTRWGGSLFLEAALLFGLLLAPKIFSAVADALLWCMYAAEVTSVIQYMDDFRFRGHPDSGRCEEVLIGTGTMYSPRYSSSESQAGRPAIAIGAHFLRNQDSTRSTPPT